jgi:dihydrofolate synthase/folylpolyglutamate synthase
MSYVDAIESLSMLTGELHSAPGQPRRKFRLEEMRVLAEALGEPQTKFPSVLIAGTNGKGSTAATLAAILQQAGYRTGLYTSPHLSRVNERVRVFEPLGEPQSKSGGEPIEDDDFARLYFVVDDCAQRLVAEGRLPAHPSYFETMTALAFLAFAEAKVDIAVLEVGMGGRLDATNIVEPLISVITDVSLDHTEWLGDTIAAIAGEKAGILRRGGVLVTLPQHPEANQAIGEIAVELDVRGVNAAEYMPVQGSVLRMQGTGLRNRYELVVRGERVEVDSPLAGGHQQRNIALAVAAAVELSNNHGYKLDASHLASGIRDTKWPGRLERFAAAGQADVLVDVGHNPAGAWALRSVLSGLEPAPATMTLVFGCLRDKAFGEMAQILFPVFDRVVLTTVDSPRAANLDELWAAAAATGADAEKEADAGRALAKALAATPADGLVVVTGSVYLIGELRPRLMERA